MAKLDAADRRAIPADKFGVPGERRFPMPDAGHARAALSMVGRAKDLSPEQKAHIRSMAKTILGGAR